MTPHPQRCETCRKCEMPSQKQRMMGQIPYCDEADISITPDMGDMIERLGCASHSSRPNTPAAPHYKDIIGETAATIRNQKRREIIDFIDCWSQHEAFLCVDQDHPVVLLPEILAMLESLRHPKHRQRGD